MFSFTPPGRGTVVGLAAVASLALAPGASAAIAPGEQVNRGTGVAGAGGFTGTVSVPRAISDDGRLSLFDHYVNGPTRRTQSAAEKAASGVYVRDVLTNTTTQVASGNHVTTGLTDAQDRISLYTTAALSAAETATPPPTSTRST